MQFVTSAKVSSKLQKSSLVGPLMDTTHPAASSTGYKNILKHGVSLDVGQDNLNKALKAAKAQSEKEQQQDISAKIEAEKRLVGQGSASLVE